MPFAEIAHTKYETTVEAAKIGYRFSLEEVNQAMMIPGMNLTSDKAAAARRAAEELVEKVVISGDTRKGFLGLVNQTGVPQAAVPNGAGELAALGQQDAGRDPGRRQQFHRRRLVGHPADRAARHRAAAGDAIWPRSPPRRAPRPVPTPRS